MSTHPQVVIAAPHRHLSTLPPGHRVILSEWEDVCASVHRFEDAICVVLFLLADFPVEEAIVVKTGSHWRGKRLSVLDSLAK